MDAIDDAGYRLVHDFPGGAPALAPLVNMNMGTLLNKANPHMRDHQLTVRQAIAIQKATEQFLMLYAEARLLRHVCIPLGKFPGASDVELLDLYARYHQELGETAAEIRKALAACKITRRMYNEIEREAFEDAAAMFELLARLKSLVVDDE